MFHKKFLYVDVVSITIYMTLNTIWSLAYIPRLPPVATPGQRGAGCARLGPAIPTGAPPTIIRASARNRKIVLYFYKITDLDSFAIPTQQHVINTFQIPTYSYVSVYLLCIIVGVKVGNYCLRCSASFHRGKYLRMQHCKIHKWLVGFNLYGYHLMLAYASTTT